MKSDRDEIATRLREGREWIDELEQETDRGAAVLAGAFIENLLEAALSKVLVADAKVRKRVHFGQFAKMVDWARSLGVISDAVDDDLLRLSKIRNKFAHRLHGLKFETRDIATLCHDLTVAKTLGAAGNVDADTPRKKFILTAVFLARYLELRTRHLTHAAPPRGWRTV